jgi:hypothetical protein
MRSFKDPSYQDRVGQSADAKNKALAQFRQRPALDEKVVEARKAAHLRRETAKAQKAIAKKAADNAASDSKAAEAAAKAAVPPPPSDAERKAARDARYAARKKRR